MKELRDLKDLTIHDVQPISAGGGKKSEWPTGCPTPAPFQYKGGDRIHPGNARKSGWHGAQQLAQCAGQHILLDVQGAVMALVVRQ